ncbi:isoprenoid synthase domain-containing protein [Microdochium bolleyi]|uniref:Terpene synthase n=1 Tax=Microdochium bolleyi TaxID=196109 RepID=A0A136IJY7_9PEZI|nr:isoprenoid synthase domain-containing protein [Microdochium bolleyi]
MSRLAPRLATTAILARRVAGQAHAGGFQRHLSSLAAVRGTGAARGPLFVRSPAICGSSRSLATVAADLPRAEVLSIVKGQTLRIPNYERLFDDWPQLVNPHKSSVTEVVNEIVQKYAVSPKVSHRLKNNGLDVLVATWFPLASRERLAELSQFVCWMFIVDDEIDALAKASVEDFKHLWSEVLRVISESCGLHGNEAAGAGAGGFRKSDFQAAETFRPFGELLMQRYSVEQRQRFWDELEKTAQGYIQLHEFTKLDRIPDYDAYCFGRYGSSCMAQNLSMFEYANESNIPQHIMESPELQTLWRATTDSLWINNDIFSFRKEIADDFTDNLLLIASKPDYNLQTGLDHCVERMESAVAKLNDAVEALEQRYMGELSADGGADGRVAQDLEKFIACCRAISAGTFKWSLATPRYGTLGQLKAADGSISFKAGEKQAVI